MDRISIVSVLRTLWGKQIPYPTQVDGILKSDKQTRYRLLSVPGPSSLPKKGLGCHWDRMRSLGKPMLFRILYRKCSMPACTELPIAREWILSQHFCWHWIVLSVLEWVFPTTAHCSLTSLHPRGFLSQDLPTASRAVAVLFHLSSRRD